MMQFEFALRERMGSYFLADYCGSAVWSFEVGGGVLTNFQDRTSQLSPSDGGFNIDGVVAFGEDAFGELYLVEYGGDIFKIVPNAPATDCNHNGRADVCDILAGYSLDQDADGVPDECQRRTRPSLPPAGTVTLPLAIDSGVPQVGTNVVRIGLPSGRVAGSVSALVLFSEDRGILGVVAGEALNGSERSSRVEFVIPNEPALRGLELEFLGLVWTADSVGGLRFLQTERLRRTILP